MTDEGSSSLNLQNFPQPPAKAPDLFMGEEQAYHEWSIIARSYLRRHGSDVPGLLRQAEASETVVRTTDMTEVAKVKSGKVMRPHGTLQRKSSASHLVARGQ